ncbi:oligosaccharide flippase family protein [Vibrio parahaemolyticus]|uniref:oligosaccharide flippase family protein n=1 Tax=Vibrio mediterranei TaxID=689 RepID=UPI00406944C0
MNRQSIVNYTIGPVASMLLGIISIPLITWYFPAEAIAANALMITLVVLLSTVMTLGLEVYYLRHYEQENPDKLLFFCAFISLVFLTIVMSCFYALTPSTLSAWLFGQHNLVIEWLIVACFYAATTIKFLLCILRMNERSFEYSLSQGVNKGLYVGLIITAIVVGKTDEQWLVICTLVAKFFTLAYLFWIVGKRTSQRIQYYFSSTKLKDALAFSIPLMINGVAMWALSSIDRFMLNSLANPFELALYSVAFNFATAAAIVQAVFATVWAPHIFKMIKGNNHVVEEYQRVLRHILHIVIALASLYGLTSWVLTWILPQSYSAVQNILVSCALVPLITALAGITTVAIQVTKKTSKIAACAAVSLIVNIMLNQWLIPDYGAVGAALGSGAAVAVYFVSMSQAAKTEGANLNLTYAYLATAILFTMGAIVALELVPGWVGTCVWLLPLLFVIQQNWSLVKHGCASLVRIYQP